MVLLIIQLLLLVLLPRWRERKSTLKGGRREALHKVVGIVKNKNAN